MGLIGGLDTALSWEELGTVGGESLLSTTRLKQMGVLSGMDGSVFG